MAEHRPDPDSSAAPAVEVRALGEITSLETSRTEQAELEQLARIFDEEIARDLVEHPGLVLVAGLSGTVYRNAVARVTRVTLRVARRYGSEGIRIALLKRVYQALEVPPRLAEAIERKLTTDGVGGVSCGRLYFAGSRESWSRLARTRAE